MFNILRYTDNNKNVTSNWLKKRYIYSLCVLTITPLMISCAPTYNSRQDWDNAVALGLDGDANIQEKSAVSSETISKEFSEVNSSNEPEAMQPWELYESGLSNYERQKYAEALPLLRAAAETGRADAKYYLGNMYEKGLGVEQNSLEAVRWYRQAAEHGNADAQTKVGYMLANGYGVKKDDAEGISWYLKAAEQGNTLAKDELRKMNPQRLQEFAEMYTEKKEYTEAELLYRAAAEQGLTGAQAGLAVMYYNGTGVRQDDAEGYKWMRKAADQGEASSEFNVGWAYRNGRGVMKDDMEACKWFRKAAEHGYGKGAGGLGYMYENGYGVKKDNKEAMKWYRVGADQGDIASKNDLHRMEIKMGLVKKKATTPIGGTLPVRSVVCESYRSIVIAGSRKNIGLDYPDDCVVTVRKYKLDNIAEHGLFSKVHVKENGLWLWSLTEEVY